MCIYALLFYFIFRSLILITVNGVDTTSHQSCIVLNCRWKKCDIGSESEVMTTIIINQFKLREGNSYKERLNIR